MNSKARLFIVSLVVVTAMLVGVVASPFSARVAKAQEGKSITVGFAQEPDSYNQWYSTMSFALWTWYLGNANLWDYNEKLEPIPVLVEKVPTVENGLVSKDGKTITLKLKKDLKWSDGEALTADDIVFTLTMLHDKANNFNTAAAFIE